MPLYLHTSNRLEKLAAVFAELVAADPLPPLIPETVILQSGGMARWLSMRLAERLGVSANIVFPFPNGFVGELFTTLLPESASARKLDKRMLQWQLMRVLPELLGRAEFQVLEEYLAGGRDLKRYQLAGRLADLFDQYTIFRPEMILDWEEGGGDSWQALLWRELIAREDCLAGVANRARLQKECLEILERPSPAAAAVPSRLTVFGLSTIPPYYLKIFAALARNFDVHIFFLNPCREYWGDIVSEKTMARLSGSHTTGADLYLTQGNPLLASTGLQGRELLSLLLDFDFAGELEMFVEPGAEQGADCMLTAVQGDILDLRDGSPRPGRELAGDDRSIMVHSCHSPMRELEVLHDQLLAMFEEFADLGPHEIIVMTPDIEAYGPLIDAVFGSRKVVDGRNLPFSIADRTLKREGTLFNAFLHLLELAGGRMEVSRVMAALEKEPVRGRFALSLKDLELIEKWITGVNIRWGIDGEDRRRLGLPATVENTWRFGIDRLLLGYAMLGRNRRDFAGILPFDDLEGGQVETLGRFLDFATGLFTHIRRLNGKRSLADWADILLAIFREFLEVAEEQEGEGQFIVAALTGLREVEASGDFGGEVEFDVIMAELQEIGRSDSLSSGFLAGGITFCEMLPMRAVPFKVVCLLGMNDHAFPRPAIPPAFDLISANPRAGDRSRRKDDRYLFLESILSARQCLYLSYVGQSVRDGASLPTSVLVSELIEYLAGRFEVGKERILTTHPLQPFSPEYFTSPSKLFSYSASNCAAARTLAEPRRERLLITEPLPVPPDEFREVSLDELVRFFANPARYFCRKRLGVYPDDEDAELATTENFNLDYLDRYRLGEIILDERLGEEAERDHFAVACRQGVMPHGSVARAAFCQLSAEVDELIGRLGMVGKGDFELLRGELEIDSSLLSGQLETSPESGQLIYRYAKLKASDQIRGWLRHLYLDRLAPAGWSRTTRVIGKDRSISFAPLEGDNDLLADLLALYRQGLAAPLPFFPETSLAFAVAKSKGLADAAALFKAGRVWRGNDYARGEADERYRRLCYNDQDPLDRDFAGVALTFFEPLLAGSDN